MRVSAPIIIYVQARGLMTAHAVMHPFIAMIFATNKTSGDIAQWFPTKEYDVDIYWDNIVIYNKNLYSDVAEYRKLEPNGGYVLIRYSILN